MGTDADTTAARSLIKPLENPVVYDIGFGISVKHIADILNPKNEYVEDIQVELYYADVLILTTAITPTDNPAFIYDDLRDSIAELKTAAELAYLDDQFLTCPPWTRQNMRHAAGFALTDEGNACRFEEECRGWFVYDTHSDSWYCWVRNHWEPAGHRLMQAGRFLACTISEEYQLTDPVQLAKEKLEAAWKLHVKYSQSLRGIKAMIELAAANMSVDFARVSDVSLMACKNGLIDRKTGEFIPLEKSADYKQRYPTVYVDCEFLPNPDTPVWNHHLETVMLDNQTGLPLTEAIERSSELSEYLRCILGYALYPGNPERLFIFWWGTTTNGKSTTMDVVSRIVGEQAGTAPLSQLYTSDTDRPAPGVADVLPKTIAFFSEASGDYGSKISTAAFKELSGESYTSRFRRMHANNERLRILCLPIGVTNALPAFDNASDPAVLKRMVTIPFRHTFSAENKDVVPALMAEKDGIFSQMVLYLQKYCRNGLPMPPDCALLAQSELLIGDDMYRFYTEYLEPSDTERLTYSALQNVYLKWCELYEVDVRTRTVRDGDVSLTRLAKSEMNALIAASRVMKYQTQRVHGIRYILARLKVN